MVVFLLQVTSTGSTTRKTSLDPSDYGLPIFTDATDMDHSNVSTNPPIVSSSSPDIATYPHSSPSSIISSCVSEGSVFMDSRTSKEQANKIFAAAGVSPFDRKRRKSRRYLSKKLAVTGLNLSKLLLSASKLDVQPSALRQQDCSHCEQLVAGLVQQFPNLPDKKEKYRLLTCTPKLLHANDVVDKFNCSKYMGRVAVNIRNTLGPFSHPNYKEVGHYKITEDLISKIHEFYLRSDNGRIMPGMRDTVKVWDVNIKVKVARAKHEMLTSQTDLYLEFCKEFPDIDISLSSFAIHKPKQCRWPGKKGFQKTCLCVHHQNFHLLLNALKVSTTSATFLEQVLCSPSTEECYQQMCSECPSSEKIKNAIKLLSRDQSLPTGSFGRHSPSSLNSDSVQSDDEDDDEEIKYHQWSSEGPADLRQIVGTKDEVFDLIKSKIPAFARHHYILRKQNEFFQHLKVKCTNENSMIVHVDFAENYSFVIGEEIQGYHWTNNQMTIHPFHCTWADENRELRKKLLWF